MCLFVSGELLRPQADGCSRTFGLQMRSSHPIPGKKQNGPFFRPPNVFLLI